MAGFVYFLEDAPNSINAQAIIDRNLSGVFESQSPAAWGMASAGPEGLHGKVLCDNPRVPDKLCKYYKDRQTWRRRPGSEKTWLGWFTDDPPGPDSLARADQLPGHEVELADGNRWLIPVARAIDQEVGQFVCRLPKKIDLDENGDWTLGRIVGKYQSIWDLSVWWFDVVTQGEPDGAVVNYEADPQEVLDAACVVLSANYCVGKPEVAALGLLTMEIAHEVLLAAIDWPTFREWSKKNEASAG